MLSMSHKTQKDAKPRGHEYSRRKVSPGIVYHKEMQTSATLTHWMKRQVDSEKRKLVYNHRKVSELWKYGNVYKA